MYNPLDSNPNSDDPSEAQNALGGSPGKFWHTSYYVSYPQYGHLKKGAGLILDMGQQVRLSQMSVQFGSSCCAEVTIEVGNSNGSSALSSFTPVTPVTKASGSTTFTISNSKATGRYVLIWITSLPPLTGNEYQAQIYDVSIHGTTV